MAVVRGQTPGRSALRVSTPGFQPAPSAIHFRQNVPPSVRQWKESLHNCGALRVIARATQPATKSLEIVVIEADGTPWGTVVPLTGEWREIDIPLNELRFFSHWSHPETRGGSGDYFHAEAVDAVNVCLGAWLYGLQASQPHGIELQTIALLPEAHGQEHTISHLDRSGE